MSPLAFVISGLIILWTGWDTDWKLGVSILIGYVILDRQPGAAPERAQPTLDWRAASWLPVYLVGMGVIVYISAFGPMDDPVAPVRLGHAGRSRSSAWSIFYWAIAVALPKEKIEEMIEEVVLPEEEGLEAPAH